MGQSKVFLHSCTGEMERNLFLFVCLEILKRHTRPHTSLFLKIYKSSVAACVISAPLENRKIVKTEISRNNAVSVKLPGTPMLGDVELSAHAHSERRGQDFGMSVSVVGVCWLWVEL